MDESLKSGVSLLLLVQEQECLNGGFSAYEKLSVSTRCFIPKRFVAYSEYWGEPAIDAFDLDSYVRFVQDVCVVEFYEGEQCCSLHYPYT